MQFDADDIRSSLIALVEGDANFAHEPEIAAWFVEVGYVNADGKPTDAARAAVDIVRCKASWQMFENSRVQAGITSCPWGLRLKHLGQIIEARIHAMIQQGISARPVAVEPIEPHVANGLGRRLRAH